MSLMQAGHISWKGEEENGVEIDETDVVIISLPRKRRQQEDRGAFEVMSYVKEPSASSSVFVEPPALDSLPPSTLQRHLLLWCVHDNAAAEIEHQSWQRSMHEKGLFLPLPFKLFKLTDSPFCSQSWGWAPAAATRARAHIEEYLQRANLNSNVRMSLGRSSKKGEGRGAHSPVASKIKVLLCSREKEKGNGGKRAGSSVAGVRPP